MGFGRRLPEHGRTLVRSSAVLPHVTYLCPKALGILITTNGVGQGSPLGAHSQSPLALSICMIPSW
jgi:hypothetical protein